MGLIHSPSIVSDGLVLALDAQNSRSYGGSGTTWTDVSYNGNNGTLTNGPTFEPGGPFAGSTGGSVYFDGGDTLTLDGSAGNAGTGDFTMEFWFKGSKMEFNYARTLHITSSGIGIYFQLIYGDNIIQFDNSDWQDGNWHHHAIVRTGSTVKWYIDGVLKGTGTDSRSTNSATNFLIGQGFYGHMIGYVSNFRFVTSALYTSNFTPPTKPLTPVSGTSLLTCQGGAIVDNSSNKFSITKNGDARAIQSASIKFDGSNEYVITPSNSNFNLGTGDFAVEIWAYLNDITSNSGFVGIINRHNYSTNTGWGIWKESGGKFGFWYNALTQINGTTNVSTNRWYHIVATRLGSTITLYVNGVSENSATNSSFTDSSTSLGIGVANVGGAWNDTYPVNGYISNTRIYKGKGLTAAEVSQNFNALRGRFGV